MEKNSSVIFTQSEVDEIRNGTVPNRLMATWGFTIDELRAIISSGNYTVTSWTISEPGTEGQAT